MNDARNSNRIILEYMCGRFDDSFSYGNAHFSNFDKGVNEKWLTEYI